MSLTPSYEPPMCLCGCPEGDHLSPGRPAALREPKRGRCLVCACQGFMPDTVPNRDLEVLSRAAQAPAPNRSSGKQARQEAEDA